MGGVEKVLRIFTSFAAQEKADREKQRAMTPEERMRIYFALRERGIGDGVDPRLARVYRVFQRGEG
jgi:hypothetical protein